MLLHWLFNFSNQQNHGNTANDCYFKADTESPSSAYVHGHVVQSNPAVIATSTSSVEAVHRLMVDSETARRCRDENRLTPVMLQQSNRNQQLIQFNSHDAASMSSSPSSNSCVQTPVISDVSKDSSLSDEVSQFLPTGEILAENQLGRSLGNDGSSLNNVRLAHCSSETNLVSSSGSQQHPNRSHRTHGAVGGRQVVGRSETSLSVEQAQQLRRRSRSADNLSRQRKQKTDSAAWSAVDIDIGTHTESTVTDRAQQLDVQRQLQMKESSVEKKSVDSLPSPFTTTRLRPFRQQMNSVVVRSC